MIASNILMAIDIGTTKICALIARTKDDSDESMPLFDAIESPLEVIGIGRCPSYGLKQGTVVDLDSTTHSIREAAQEAMSRAGVQPRRVIVGIAGDFIRNFNSIGKIAVTAPERGITKDDLRRAIRAAIYQVVPKDFDMIHAIPRLYKVDDVAGIIDPLGMAGKVLEADVHVVAGRKTALRNIRNCVGRAGFQVSDIALQPIASSFSVLSEEERQAGIALVDIGGGTTDIVVYHEGYIQHSQVILIGGNYISKDICRAFVTPFDSAENLKRKYGTAFSELIDPGEMVEISRIAGRQPISVTRQDFSWVIEARVEQILEQIQTTLQTHQLGNKLFAGIVLTGGTALLEGIREKAETFFNLEVQIGFPDGITGYKDILNNPMFATAVGLLHYGRDSNSNYSRKNWGWFSRFWNNAYDKIGASLTELRTGESGPSRDEEEKQAIEKTV